jgi:hypothetical protein
MRVGAITRINLALDRIELALTVYAAVIEFAARGWRHDA